MDLYAPQWISMDFSKLHQSFSSKWTLDTLTGNLCYPEISVKFSVPQNYFYLCQFKPHSVIRKIPKGF